MQHAECSGRGEKATKSGMAEAANTNALRIMAAKELNRRHALDGVSAFSCHPGVVKTEVALLPTPTTCFEQACAKAMMPAAGQLAG